MIPERVFNLISNPQQSQQGEGRQHHCQYREPAQLSDHVERKDE